MLNKKDLVLIKYDQGLLKLLNKFRKDILSDLVLQWYKKPELRPPNSTPASKDAYKEMKKVAIMKEITEVDWPDGLYACQVAQLKLQDLAFSSLVKSYKLLTLYNKSKNIKQNLSLTEIKQSLEKCLSVFFDTYVYAEHNQELDTYVFIVSIQQVDQDATIFEDRQFAILVYYPETNNICSTRKFWNTKDQEEYMHNALTETFDATDVLIEEIPFPGFDNLRDSIMNRSKLGGIIKQLQKEEGNSNPLNIKEKRSKGFEEIYMKTREQRKRIVPINMEKMKLQYETIDENFGWDDVRGHKTLDVNLEVPFDSGKKNNMSNTEYENDVVEIFMKIEGINVAKGIRDLITNGVIETPAAGWLQSVAVSRAKKITVTEEGIFQRQDDVNNSSSSSSNKRPRIDMDDD